MRYITIIILSLLITDLSGQTNWLIDKNGCKVHNPYPRKGEAVLWAGDCKDSLASGKGQLVWYLFGFKTKNVFDGEMIKGKPEGQGFYTFSDGTILEGEFKNGHFYRGTKKEKLGKTLYTYKGDFNDNNLNGHGELIVEGLYKYVGEFIDGVEQGSGIQYAYNGEVFEGVFEEGYYKRGTLKSIRNGGMIIIGDFNEFEPTNGTIIYKDSTKYVGQIKDYVPHGKGTLYLTDGGVFKCQWVKRTAHGYGEYKLSNDVIYKGKWVNGVIDGQGQIIYPDGKINTGIWKDGELIEEKVE